MLKNLKSIFIVEEEVSKKKAPQKAAKAEASQPKATPSPTSVPNAEVRPGQITSKFVDTLLTAMDKANLQGFDYLEYKKSLQSLQKMQMDEATAYKSAFAMAQTMNATPEHLTKTANHYLSALKQEEQKFATALNNQRGSRIGSKEKEQEQHQTAIAQKEAQIKQLQQDIEQHQKKLSALSGEIKKAVSTIENTKNDFFASYKHIVQQIQDDIEKMGQYLK